MTIAVTSLILLTLIGLGCYLWRRLMTFSAQSADDYAATAPAFDVQKHLSGPMVSDGVIYGPRGRVAVRFVATMNGVWDGDRGVLSEDFSYASGTSQHREWTLTMGQDGAFTATADDIVGVARGQQRGAVVKLTYKLRLMEEAGGHVLDVTDWMYLLDNGTIMNRSQMRKFGIKVAELVASIRPAGPTDTPAPK